jgi:hypothetical protein
MIKQIGSQRREPIEETEYLIDFIDGPGDVFRDAFLIDTATGRREKWTENDDFAGYVIEIDGVGFEFVCEV